MSYQSSTNKLESIIDIGDIRTTFNKIVKFFDPNKSKNKKTKVLDCSNFYIWNEEDIRLFDITKSNNLSGSVVNNKYDLIIFEPPCNKSLAVISIEYGKVFYDVLKSNGVIIVKTKDFKDGNKLKGSFDIRISLETCGLHLENQIIYKNKRQDNYKDNKEVEIDIIHSYFMIFKKN